MDGRKIQQASEQEMFGDISLHPWSRLFAYDMGQLDSCRSIVVYSNCGVVLLQT